MRALFAALALTAPAAAATVPVHHRAPWPALVRCETAGTMNWAIHSRARDAQGVPLYWGGIQATTGFWSTYGGHAFAPRADKATPAAQITVAIRARDGWPKAADPGARRPRGYRPWPTCARRLGLVR